MSLDEITEPDNPSVSSACAVAIDLVELEFASFENAVFQHGCRSSIVSALTILKRNHSVSFC